jgi:transcriptional regulator with XRE-family HTH domain
MSDIVDALEFRRDQLQLTQKFFAKSLHMQASHYNEFVKGKRNLPLKAMKLAVEVHDIDAVLLITGKFQPPRKPNEYTDLVNNFLKWHLPKTLNPDMCVHDTNYPHRIGTNLMTADEAMQMFKYCIEGE